MKPRLKARKSYPTKEEILKSVLIVNNCWVWRKTLSNGYGEVRRDAGRMRMHRYSKVLFDGLDMSVLKDKKKVFIHSCDIRACVNPAHLTVGTQEENVADCISKMRHAYGTKSGLSKLNTNDVFRIKKMLAEKKLLHKEIAELFSVSRATISQINRGFSWKHIKEITGRKPTKQKEKKMSLVVPSFEELADITPGDYKARITGAEVTTSKTSGTPMVVWKMEIFDSPVKGQNGQVVTHRTMLSGKGAFGIKDLYRATMKEELKGPFDTDMLLGKELKITMVPGRPQQDGSPSRYPEIKSVNGI